MRHILVRALHAAAIQVTFRRRPVSLRAPLTQQIDVMQRAHTNTPEILQGATLKIFRFARLQKEEIAAEDGFVANSMRDATNRRGTTPNSACRGAQSIEQTGQRWGRDGTGLYTGNCLPPPSS
jgi:hypothetical protein